MCGSSAMATFCPLKVTSATNLTHSRALIEGGRHADPASVDQPLVHEVHGSALVRPTCHSLGHALPLSGAVAWLHPHDQPLLRVEPVDPLRGPRPYQPGPERRGVHPKGVK